jgi:hypothetical protein
MGTTALFKPTAIQKKALALLKSGAKHILLFGGSRSGKTTVLVMAIIYRALRFAGSRHLICRYRAKDARSSVLRETLLPWLDNTIGKNGYTYLAHESMATLYNGSEIWIGGLGDREQADKILGHEYNTIYFNEISQLSYAAVTTAYSRLAMRVPGCRNMFVYDCNPGSGLTLGGNSNPARPCSGPSGRRTPFFYFLIIILPIFLMVLLFLTPNHNDLRLLKSNTLPMMLFQSIHIFSL